MLRAFLISLSVLCAVSCSPIEKKQGDIPPSAIASIREYVQVKRGWLESEYRIEPQGRLKGECCTLEYWVVHLPSERQFRRDMANNRFSNNSGKSFAVYVDEQNFSIIRELAFQ